MTGLRHNPYVGSFHGKNFQSADGMVSKQLIMEESKRNPLIGVFRHSPSVPSKSLGLKSILYRETTQPPIFSQLQVSRDVKKFPTHNFLRSFRQIPTKVFTASSVGSKSSVSGTSPPAHVEDDENLPTCSICLDPYADGDELRTFACSHCFHNECVSKWIFHRCLNNDELDSFNCPECRQNHITLSEAGSSRTSLAEGISSMSFLQVGENMAREGGYDFLSDFGSDLQSPGPNSMPASPRPLQRRGSSGDNSVGIASGESSPSDRPSTGGATASTTTAAGVHLDAPIPRSPGDPTRMRPPVPLASPSKRPIPLANSFGSRMSVLSKSSNRLMGIFPVPEDSYCVTSMTDSVYTTARSPSNTTTSSVGESIFTASALNVSVCLPVTTTAAPVSAVPQPPAAVPAWTTLDPLCASAYSDCGIPLPK